MKKLLSILITVLCVITVGGTPHQSLFRTSKCYDLLASVQNFDNLKDVPEFSGLARDTLFMQAVKAVNDKTRASNLCNIYSLYGNDKDKLDSCISFISNMPDMIPEQEQAGSWIKNILSVKPQLEYVLNSLKNADYSQYWENSVLPRLEEKINSYYSHIPEGILDNIHSEMATFASPEQLSEIKTNIYILDISNAFNLLDETFCSTPLLLDPELEKQYHLDFLKVYIHENLHRLSISNELMERLNSLVADDFYQKREQIAATHNEGRNEAFIVAAEVFLSNKLGRRDDRSVFEEFNEYVDGSLVLAPIIYVHLEERLPTETYSEFIMRLFDNGTISVGKIETEYNNAMNKLKARIE